MVPINYDPAVFSSGAPVIESPILPITPDNCVTFSCKRALYNISPFAVFFAPILPIVPLLNICNIELDAEVQGRIAVSSHFYFYTKKHNPDILILYESNVAKTSEIDDRQSSLAFCLLKLMLKFELS